MPKQSSTPVRRSKRFQPLVTPSHILDTDSTASWSSEPLLIRATQPDDLWEEEQQEPDASMQTVFYSAFDRMIFTTRIPGQRKKPISETLKVGDTVLVSTAEKLPSVAVITSMWEVIHQVDHSDDGDREERKMRVKVHWFLRPTEMARVRAKRDHIENEIYFSLHSTAIFSTAQIIRRCVVSSRKPTAQEIATFASRIKLARNKRRQDQDSDDADIERFYCESAVDSNRGLFYKLNWESHHGQSMSENGEHEWGTGDEWKIVVEDLDISQSTSENDDHEWGTSDEDESDESDVDDDDDVFDADASKNTPRKTTTSNTTTTPRRNRRTLAFPTPHSKVAIRARARKKIPARSKSFVVRPPQEPYRLQIDHVNLSKDPWLRAMHVLHVAARPDALPCREEEYVHVLRSVEELLEEGSGGCIYIAGVPGTGKTATVHAVVRELKRMAEQSEINPFTFVEINGLKITEPSAAYALLWESVSGHDVALDGHLKISAKESLKQLTRHFSAGVRAGPRGHACVVLMDELDQLMTAKQEVVYNFFNWPTLAGSKLVVLAVANTMDLPERVMTGRVRSRLGMVRINFQPYGTPELETIVKTRLESAKEGLKGKVPDVIAADGIKFAAMKVASISGDARRVLEICRRTVELVQPDRRTARTDDVRNVIKVMQNSPTAAYLRECSLHERIMLASLLKCMKREGVEEIKWGDIKHQHLIYMNILPGDDEPTRKPTQSELSFVLDSLLASRAILVEDGLAVSRKPEDEKKVVLNLEQGEVERILGEEGGHRWKNVLST